MRKYHPDTDPATIPTDVLLSERARRNVELRKTHAGGRPKVLRPCPRCHALFGAVELRGHRCAVCDAIRLAAR